MNKQNKQKNPALMKGRGQCKTELSSQVCTAWYREKENVICKCVKMKTYISAENTYNTYNNTYNLLFYFYSLCTYHTNFPYF